MKATQAQSLFASFRPVTIGRPREILSHLPGLDAVRGIAVVLVMVSHFGEVLSPGGAVNYLFTKLFAAGWSGVDVFFTLSGFLITRILLATRDRSGYFRSFYMRRVLRIFPLYYLSLVAYTVIFGGRGTWWYWLYIANWAQLYGVTVLPLNHFWSLAVEEQFYLIWPLVILLARTKRQLVLTCLFAIGACAVLKFVLSPDLPTSTIYRLTPTRIDSLAMGGLTAICSAEFSRYRRQFVIAGLSIALLAAVACRGFELAKPAILAVGPAAIALVTMGLILSGMQQPAEVLRWIWLNKFGKYSYAMYVFHYPLHLLALSRGIPLLAERGTTLPATIAYICVMIAITYGLAAFSWFALERRILVLKSYFTVS
jgi:peptidoglycan/LPS O-acetylase OafA/YrhL